MFTDVSTPTFRYKQFFFVIPIYLQSVLVHSANCVKTCIHVYSSM
jgi:hypothetical protein